MRKSWMTVAVLLLALSLGGCGYNTLQSNDEQIKSSWSEVLNQYQRRADLVPNLVNTVKGFAAHYYDCIEDARKQGYRGPFPAGPKVALRRLPEVLDARPRPVV